MPSWRLPWLCHSLRVHLRYLRLTIHKTFFPFFLLSVAPDNVWRERESEVPPFLGTSELVGSSEEVGWTEDITH